MNLPELKMKFLILACAYLGVGEEGKALVVR